MAVGGEQKFKTKLKRKIYRSTSSGKEGQKNWDECAAQQFGAASGGEARPHARERKEGKRGVTGIPHAADLVGECFFLQRNVNTRRKGRTARVGGE